MSKTPVVHLELRICPQIFNKILKGPNVILRGLRETDSWKKTWSRKSRGMSLSERAPTLRFPEAKSIILCYSISYLPNYIVYIFLHFAVISKCWMLGNRRLFEFMTFQATKYSWDWERSLPGITQDQREKNSRRLFSINWLSLLQYALMQCIFSLVYCIFSISANK